MKIYVNGTDVSEKISANSVQWRTYGTFRSDLVFNLEPFFTDGIFICDGMRAYIENDFGLRVWGGVVTSVKQTYRNESRCGITVRCKGYEAVLSHRICDNFSIEATTSGLAARTLFLIYLASTSETGEGFLYNAGLFCEGVPVSVYETESKPLAKVFDELASMGGSRWWIKEDGTFYFTDDIDITDCPYCVDLTCTATNRLTDIGSLEFSRESSDYRNVQVVLGADGVRGESSNVTEISRMAAYGGSGRYENVVKNPNIDNEGAATTAAVNILRSYSTENVTAVFQTDTDGISLFNKIMINAPQFGFYGLTPFVVTEITATDIPNGNNGLGFRYKIKAKLAETGATSFRPAEYWTETIARISG